MNTKAKCTICGQEMDIRGMRMHMTKHTTEQTSEQTSVQTTEQNSTLDSNKLNNDLATLSDSVRTKDADIALLNDSIEQKDAEFEQIKAELADAISLEHEQELVRNVFKKLTPEAYEQIGQQLGF
jgi:molecular chaperone GrpE (heat shock protein)